MNNSSSCLECVPLKSQMYQNLEDYAYAYWQVHPYLSLTICVFGISTNLVNVFILCQEKMRSPINCILTGIAVSDILNMLDYMPYAIQYYLLTDLDDTVKRYTHFWSSYLMVHSCLSVTLHTISLWLAVAMSAVRYLFIRSRGRWNLTLAQTRMLITGVYLFGVMVSLPNYIVTDLQPSFVPAYNTTLYRIKSLKIYLGDSTTMNAINVWLFVLVGKLIPLCLICVFGSLLLKTIRHSVQLTESLKLTSCSRRMRAHKRTTIMLLAIMAMFIASELPAAILILISVFKENFFMDYYLLFADTLDIISLTNNAINFVMYCIMSRQFRDSLCETLPFCNMVSANGYKAAPTTNGRPFSATQL